MIKICYFLVMGVGFFAMAVRADRDEGNNKPRQSPEEVRRIENNIFSDYNSGAGFY